MCISDESCFASFVCFFSARRSLYLSGCVCVRAQYNVIAAPRGEAAPLRRPREACCLHPAARTAGVITIRRAAGQSLDNVETTTGTLASGPAYKLLAVNLTMPTGERVGSCSRSRNHLRTHPRWLAGAPAPCTHTCAEPPWRS